MRAPIALLTFAAAALIAVPGTSFAQVAPRPQVGVRTEVYVDDDGTTIWRPRASVGVPVGGDYAVNATYLADVVSSASIDVVTRASKPIGELHQEATLAVSRALPREGSVAVGYGFVHEPDFLGNAISFVGGVDLGANREYHVSTRLVGGISRVGTVVDPQFEEHIYSCLATAGLSRIVNARLVLRGNLELQNLYGFLGSPYRTVRIGDWSGMPYTGTDPDALAWVFTGVTATARRTSPTSDSGPRSRWTSSPSSATASRSTATSACTPTAGRSSPPTTPSSSASSPDRTSSSASAVASTPSRPPTSGACATTPRTESTAS